MNASGALEMESGHGTFIAGIIRQYCPDAEIHIDGVLSSFGDGDDSSIGAGIERAVERLVPEDYDVVVMSLGAYTENDQPPPLARWISEFFSDVVVVAAAGNSNSPRPVLSGRACPTSSPSGRSILPDGLGSRTTAAGSTPARPESTW